METHQILNSFVFGIGVVLMAVGVLAEPESVSLGCYSNGFLCNNPLVSLEGMVFFALALPILVTSLTLFFLRREVFYAWMKFAAVGFPVMLFGLLYFFRTPEPTGSWVGGPSEAQIASFVLPVLFVIASFVVIVRKVRESRT